MMIILIADKDTYGNANDDDDDDKSDTDDDASPWYETSWW